MHRQAVKERILVAGIGDIFFGDDGFGVEVVARLAGKLPDCVHVADFGIRGFDLAFALMDGYEATILVDALSRNGTPSSIFFTRKQEIADSDGFKRGIRLRREDPACA